jgi:allantoin racemase
VRLLIANPNATAPVTDACVLLARAAASPGTEIVGWTNAQGPPLVDSWYADYFAGRPLLQGLRAVAPAPDAVVLAGFGNYGTFAVKEALEIPVVAMPEAAMAMAMPLCHRFAIITTAPRMIAYTEELVGALGFRERCAGVTAVTLPALGVAAREDAVLMELATEVERVRVLSRADLIILGGSRLSPFAEPLRKLTSFTVLEPLACAVQMAESLVRLHIVQTKTGKYAAPPQPFESYD